MPKPLLQALLTGELHPPHHLPMAVSNWVRPPPTKLPGLAADPAGLVGQPDVVWIGAARI